MTTEELIKLSKRSGVSVRKIIDVVAILEQKPEMGNLELIRSTGLAKSAVAILRSSGLTEVCVANSLFEEDEWGFLMKDGYADELMEFKRSAQNRVKADRKYDQFLATEETVVRRARLMNFFGDTAGKNILFLGDDDKTSVAVAGYADVDRITVLDIDQRVLNTIHDTSVEKKKYDARKPLLPELKNKFDTVFIDPPYTPAGVRLFLSRSIEALDKSNPTARIYICYGNSDRAKERFLPIYEIFLSVGMMTRRVYDKFNRYYGAESIGSCSSLYMLEVTPRTKPLIKGEGYSGIFTYN